MIKKLSNVALRFVNVFLKGVFVLLASKFLTLQDVGVLGVLFGYITLLMFVMGVEFWFFSNREVTTHYERNPLQTQKVVLNQFLLHICTYVLLLPVVISFFEIRYGLGLMMGLIIVSLHLSQEVSRIFMHIHKQFLSSWLSVLTQSLWTVPIFVMWFLEVQVSLEQIFEIYAWISLVGGLISLLVLQRVLKIPLSFVGKFREWFDLALIKRGLGITYLILISTVCYKLSELLARFILEYQGDLVSAGLFNYFQNIGSMVTLFVYYGITSFYIPKMIAIRGQEGFADTVKKYRQVLVLGSLFAVTMAALGGFILFEYFLDQPEYRESFNGYLIVLAGGLILNLASYFDSMAYVYRFDKVNALSSMSALLIAAVVYSVFMTLMSDRILAATLAFLTWAALLMLVKVSLYRSYHAKHLRSETA